MISRAALNYLIDLAEPHAGTSAVADEALDCLRADLSDLDRPRVTVKQLHHRNAYLINDVPWSHDPRQIHSVEGCLTAIRKGSAYTAGRSAKTLTHAKKRAAQLLERAGHALLAAEVDRCETLDDLITYRPDSTGCRVVFIE
jgi:hypothetical protein